METELTKEIKTLTHAYKPKMSCRTRSKQVGRTIRYADEVWTPNGIVDSIRFIHSADSPLRLSPMVRLYPKEGTKTRPSDFLCRKFDLSLT